MKILEILTQKRLLGNEGEKLAAKHLKKSGYKILEQNYVSQGKEIDIIAENRDYIVFVEVKTRSVSEADDNTRPALAVTPKKQRKILSAASYYYRFLKREKMLRFDVIEVYKTDRKFKINHIEGAFNANSAKERQK